MQGQRSDTEYFNAPLYTKDIEKTKENAAALTKGKGLTVVEELFADIVSVNSVVTGQFFERQDAAEKGPLTPVRLRPVRHENKAFCKVPKKFSNANTDGTYIQECIIHIL